MRYKLIKEYPNSVELGSEVVKKGDVYPIFCGRASLLGALSSFEVENFPEFWEKVEEKDYQIIIIKNKFSGNTLALKNTNIEYLYNEEDWAIESVKRLSDGEIFTIGDNTNFGIISGFGLINKNTTEKGIIVRYYRRGDWQRLSSVVKDKVLFTTEDGVDMFEGDKYWCVSRSYILCDYVVGKGLEDFYDTNECKRFSTKEKAEEYILMNKPCLSFKDVINYMDDPYSMIREYDKTNLIKLIKSKL